MSLAWTGTGESMLRMARSPIKSSDIGITRDGPNAWVFYHYSYKSAIARFTGDNATQALKALKLALITHRLTK